MESSWSTPEDKGPHHDHASQTNAISPPAFDESLSSSGQQTPHRAKKRVEWVLPTNDESPDQPPNDRPPSSNFSNDQIEELRRQLSNTLPSRDQPSSSDPQSRLPLPSHSGPKSVLRSGTMTPQAVADVDSGVEDLDVKIQSASDAQRRASRVTEDVSRDVSRDTSRNTSRASSPDRRHPRRHSRLYHTLFHHANDNRSGTSTPEHEVDVLGDSDYVPPPRRWRSGGLSAFTLQGLSHALHYDGMSSGNTSPRSHSPPHRGISNLVGQSIGLGSIGSGVARPHIHRLGSDDTVTSERVSRPHLPRSGSSGFLDQLGHIGGRLSGKSSKRGSESRASITKHIQEITQRQRFLIKLCRALMLYGAPTHRLEEYMKASSRVLETEAQFLYIPGCMIISFDDSTTHTAEIRLVRTTQGVDLGKLRDTHEVYKDVVHDDIGVMEASERLDDILKRKDKFPVWVRVIVYGFASATVGPFAFQARLIDLPIAFLLGCLLGFLQLYISGLTDLYTSVFEIVAVMLTSFLSRAAGSINGGTLFCFSALAQSSIALILPGYMVLCGALELQSKSITAGAVRLVYAVIYSLFIGFGLTLGIAIYGLVDSNATSATTCGAPIANDGYLVFISVPLYTICLMIINQAKWGQMPFMLVVSFTGYIVNYFSAERFSGNPQISAAFASLAIAFLANIHSRVGHRISHPCERFGKRVYVSFMRRVFPDRIAKMPEMKLDASSDTIMETQETPFPPPKGWNYYFWRARHPGQSIPSTAQSSRHASIDSSMEEGSAASKPRKRVQYGLAAAAMLPAIFVLVPSGLSVSGSLISGIQTGDQIAHNMTGSLPSSQQVFEGQDASNSLAFGVGYAVVQIAIGITVGLFLGTLAAYPLGKGKQVLARKETRSGIFSY